MNISLIACPLAALLLTACMRTDTLPREVTGAYEQAFNRDDLAATTALFSEDAQIMPQHGPVVSGRKEIEQYLKSQMTPVASFNTETEMTLVRHDIGVEQGHYRVRNVRRGSDIEQGKYLHVWRREDDAWKLYLMIYNTDIAPPAEVSIAAVES